MTKDAKGFLKKLQGIKLFDRSCDTCRWFVGCGKMYRNEKNDVIQEIKCLCPHEDCTPLNDCKHWKEGTPIGWEMDNPEYHIREIRGDQ